MDVKRRKLQKECFPHSEHSTHIHFFFSYLKSKDFFKFLDSTNITDISTNYSRYDQEY